jgi:hypothetical protein
VVKPATISIFKLVLYFSKWKILSNICFPVIISKEIVYLH